MTDNLKFTPHPNGRDQSIPLPEQFRPKPGGYLPELPSAQELNKLKIAKFLGLDPRKWKGPADLASLSTYRQMSQSPCGENSHGLSLFQSQACGNSSSFLINGNSRNLVQSRFLQSPYEDYFSSLAGYTIISKLSYSEAEIKRLSQKIDQAYDGLLTDLNKLHELRKASEITGDDSDAQAIEERSKIQIESLVRDWALLQSHLQVMEKWTLIMSRDRVYSKEYVLDILFKEVRHQKETGLFHPIEIDLGVLDFNMTAFNGINWELGDLVKYEAAYTVLKKYFGEKNVTWAGNSFRIIKVNPEIIKNELESIDGEIIDLAKKLACKKPLKRKFIRQLDRLGKVELTGHWSQVKVPQKLIIDLAAKRTPQRVAKLDHLISQAYNKAHLGSEQARKVAKKNNFSRNFPRYPVQTLDRSQGAALPEGTWLEPGPQRTNGLGGKIVSVKKSSIPPNSLYTHRFVEQPRSPGPARFFRNAELIRIIRGNIDQAKLFLATAGETLEMKSSDSIPELRIKIQNLRQATHPYQALDTEGNSRTFDATLNQVLKGIDHTYKLTHDLRYNRLINRQFIPERVEAMILNQGKAELLFIELGNFKTFAQGWWGGENDSYVHELIFEFYKVLIGEVLGDSSGFGVIDEKGQIIFEPENGLSMNHQKVPEKLRLIDLRTRQVKYELLIGTRGGDEIAFFVPKLDSKTRGRVFAAWEQVIRDQTQNMIIDKQTKVGKDKIRTPSWELWQIQEDGTYQRTQQDILLPEEQLLHYTGKKNKAPHGRESQAYSGWIVDFMPVKPDTSPRVDGRQARWRYFQNGINLPHLDFLETAKFGEEVSELLFSNENPLKAQAQRIEPKSKVFVKQQTRLSAGFVSIPIERGAQCQNAWSLAHEASKLAKLRGKPKIFSKLKLASNMPEGYRFDFGDINDRGEKRILELAKRIHPFQLRPIAPEVENFLRRHLVDIGKHLPLLENESQTQVYKKALLFAVENSSLKKASKKQLQEKVKAEFKKPKDAHTGKIPIVQWLDGITLMEGLKRLGLGLNLGESAPLVWNALNRLEQAFTPKGIQNLFDSFPSQSKLDLIKNYIHHNGRLPDFIQGDPQLDFNDLKNLYLPQELYGLANQYNILPESIPLVWAYLQARPENPVGSAQSLTLKEMQKLLADETILQEIRKDPKLSRAIDNRLAGRAMSRGIPMGIAFLAALPSHYASDLVMSLLDEQYPDNVKMAISFGINLYLIHGLTLTGHGIYDVLHHRHLAKGELGRILKTPPNFTFTRTGTLGGETLIQLGADRSATSVVGASIAEKLGIRGISQMGFKTGGKQLLGALNKFHGQAFHGMGTGMVTSTAYDRTLASLGFGPDHFSRHWSAHLAAFFAPDVMGSVLVNSQNLNSRLRALPRVGKMAPGLMNYFGNCLNRTGKLILLDLGFTWATTQPYEQYVNERVTEEHMDRYVWNGSWVKDRGLGMVAGARILSQFSMKGTYQWGVARDHPAQVQAYLRLDREDYRKVQGELLKSFQGLLLNPHYFQVSDKNSYWQVDYKKLFRDLEKPVELTDLEKSVQSQILAKQKKFTDEKGKEIHPEKVAKIFTRLQLAQFQTLAHHQTFLAPPREENSSEKINELARSLFTTGGILQTGGVLKPNKEKEFFDLLSPEDPDQIAGAKADFNLSVIHTRQVALALALLRGRKDFHGEDTLDLCQLVGLAKATPQGSLPFVLKPGPTTLAALILYIKENQDKTGRLQKPAWRRLDDLRTQLVDELVSGELFQRPNESLPIQEMSLIIGQALEKH